MIRSSYGWLSRLPTQKRSSSLWFAIHLGNKNATWQQSPRHFVDQKLTVMGAILGSTSPWPPACAQHAGALVSYDFAVIFEMSFISLSALYLPSQKLVLLFALFLAHGNFIKLVTVPCIKYTYVHPYICCSLFGIWADMIFPNYYFDSIWHCTRYLIFQCASPVWWWGGFIFSPWHVCICHRENASPVDSRDVDPGPVGAFLLREDLAGTESFRNPRLGRDRCSLHTEDLHTVGLISWLSLMPLLPLLWP